ncbi:MAG: hypothetical protein COA58_01715 [Bacteroidetes bacterium]|nr:MAG: hypothetical protein COA58_01715 [Bacteroidota bacterium]
MNIIYISKYASYAPYGIETRHVYISKELVKRGNEVKLYISNANHQLSLVPKLYEDKIEGVDIEWLNTLKYKRAYGAKRILSWIHFEIILRRKLHKLSNVPDLVIVSSLSLLSILNGIWLKKTYGCKLVFEIRDIWPLVLTRISSLSKKNPMYKVLEYIEKKGYSESDLIIGTMPNLKEHVDGVVPNKKVVWIPHLINPSIIHERKHTYEKELGELRKTKNTKLIAYAGSINKSSSIEILLKAASIMKHEDIIFVFLGNGPLLSTLQTKYSQENIRFFDKIRQSEVVAFLSDCDILYDGYLESDIYRYGNSRNKYVEYCLASKPIVVSYDGYPFFVSEYDCGLVVKPESEEELVKAFQLLVQKDDEELNQLGRNALNFAQTNLRIDKQVDKLLEDIKSV